MTKKLAVCLLLAFLLPECLSLDWFSSDVFLNTMSGNASKTIASRQRHTKRLAYNKRSTSSYVCSSDDTSSTMLTEFSAVFFGDFTTSGGQDILGPLAVQGKFTASSYIVNANGSPDCSSVNDNMDGYALVVGGDVDASQVRVNGQTYVPSSSDYSGLQETHKGCSIDSSDKTGLFDFDQAQDNALGASRILAGLSPNLYLDSNGKLTSLSAPTGDFNVITFNTCNDNDCDLYPGQMSDPNAMFYAKGNWNGPQGMSWPTSKTLVVNVPISVGSTFKISTNSPTMGMNPCTVIFNFYPSDSNGNYKSGKFTLKRNTASNFGAFALAPSGHIVDGSTGTFSGTIIGLDYSWSGSGVEIHNYAAAGGSCKKFNGCIPIPDGPKYTTTTTTTTTDTTTTTTTADTTTTTTADTTTTTTADTTTTTTADTTTTTTADTTTITTTTTAETTTTTGVTTTTTDMTTTTSSDIASSRTTTIDSSTTATSTTTETNSSSSTTTSNITSNISSTTTCAPTAGTKTASTATTTTTTSSRTTTSNNSCYKTTSKHKHKSCSKNHHKTASKNHHKTTTKHHNNKTCGCHHKNSSCHKDKAEKCSCYDMPSTTVVHYHYHYYYNYNYNYNCKNTSSCSPHHHTGCEPDGHRPGFNNTHSKHLPCESNTFHEITCSSNID